jgi:hypothetical protein
MKNLQLENNKLSYGDFLLPPKNYGISNLRNIDWTTVLPCDQFMKMDFDFIKIVAPRMIINEDKRYMGMVLVHSFQEIISYFGRQILNFDEIKKQDIYNKFIFLYENYLVKSDKLRTMTVGFSGVKLENIYHSIVAIQNGDKYREEDMFWFGFPRTLEHFQIEDETKFKEKVESIGRSSGYQDARLNVFYAYIFRDLPCEEMHITASERLTSHKKSDLINSIMRVRGIIKHKKSVGNNPSENPNDNILKYSDEHIEMLDRIDQRNNKILYSILDGLSMSCSYSFSNQLVMEDIPFLLGHLSKKPELYDLRRAVNFKLAGQ